MKKLIASGGLIGALLCALPAAANPVPWKLNMTQGVTATAEESLLYHIGEDADKGIADRSAQAAIDCRPSCANRYHSARSMPLLVS